MVKRQSNKIIDFFAMGAKRSKVGDQDNEEKEEKQKPLPEPSKEPVANISADEKEEIDMFGTFSSIGREQHCG